MKNESLVNPQTEPVIPPELHAVILAASQSDLSAIPALRRALAEHPELIDHLGDLARHVELGLVRLASGGNLAASEAITAHLAKLRSELGEAGASPLETLLIRRVVVCWLGVHAAEAELIGFLPGKGAVELVAAADRRVDRAHKRLLSATKALATVRKLAKPGWVAGEVMLTVVPGDQNKKRVRVAAG